ncbi:MAG TPA: GNAT family N-acetyltransferase [Candidatus Binataceae bacterium]|nr:GNAT family N-acetyltransferase [Candidatus Binataceae bacterium]
MTGRVIQGLFIGGRPRIPTPVAQPSAMPRRPGPPAPAFAGRLVAQPHGAGDAVQVDAGQLGLGSGGGQRLPEAVRGKMEAAFGADFAGVRVHVGPQAERVGAIALTTGSDIYFAPGHYRPETVQGQQLLGHELAHVMQQRAGRVRNPLGAGVAVVQDRALEAEADCLGHRAAAHRLAMQPKLKPGAAQPSAPARISAPVNVGPGSYRLTAGDGGRQVGSVMVHARDRASVEVTDLGVDPDHREHGIGQLLLASAARTGQRFGKSKMTLAAEDNGSGRLTHWYKGMGFAQVGMNRQGYAQLEAPIGRVISAVMQNSFAAPGAFKSSALQLMESKKKTKPKTAEEKKQAEKERRKKQEAQKEKSRKESVDIKKAEAENKKAAVEVKIVKQREKEELAAKAEIALREEQAEYLLSPKYKADQFFRRMETLARFLETFVATDASKTNVCVALVEIEGKIFATTNQNSIGKVSFDDDKTLLVDSNFTVEPGEQYADVSAKKLSVYFAESAELINSITQVGKDWSDNLHAEMKMLEFIVLKGLLNPVTIYISRLCCPKCWKAINKWNEKKMAPAIVVRQGTHASFYPGWELPKCIEADEELADAITGERGRKGFSEYTDLNTQSTRRERSPSPAPKGGKVAWL